MKALRRMLACSTSDIFGRRPMIGWIQLCQLMVVQLARSPSLFRTTLVCRRWCTRTLLLLFTGLWSLKLPDILRLS